MKLKSKRQETKHRKRALIKQKADAISPISNLKTSRLRVMTNGSLRVEAETGKRRGTRNAPPPLAIISRSSSCVQLSEALWKQRRIWIWPLRRTVGICGSTWHKQSKSIWKMSSGRVHCQVRTMLHPGEKLLLAEASRATHRGQAPRTKQNKARQKGSP